MNKDFDLSEKKDYLYEKYQGESGTVMMMSSIDPSGFDFSSYRTRNSNVTPPKKKRKKRRKTNYLNKK